MDAEDVVQLGWDNEDLITAQHVGKGWRSIWLRLLKDEQGLSGETGALSDW